MSWWGWIIGGAILLGAELTFVDAQFYLVFVGSAAFIVGLLTVAVPGLAPWAQWFAFAILALISMLTFRSRIYDRMRGSGRVEDMGPAGHEITLPVSLEPGESCQVEHAGAFWTARNESNSPIPLGTRARIISVRGLTLVVQPDR
jgi:membrane protein implicated in regulation of membrane protease activity